MRDVTIVFPLRSDKILLGFKKRGFGAGKWNGFGGKVEDETIRQAAARELEEECGLIAHPEDLEDRATIEFELPEIRFRAHVFTIERFEGEAYETDEMRPRWYAFENIPYDTMWEDDRFWLPLVLDGNAIDARFVWTGDLLTDISIRLRKALDANEPSAHHGF